MYRSIALQFRKGIAIDGKVNFLFVGDFADAGAFARSGFFFAAAVLFDDNDAVDFLRGTSPWMPKLASLAPSSISLLPTLIHASIGLLAESPLTVVAPHCLPLAPPLPPILIYVMFSLLRPFYPWHFEHRDLF